MLRGDLAPLAEYRDRFRPSRTCPEPHLIVSADVMIAETTERARELMLPEAWAMVTARTTGAFPPLSPPGLDRPTDRQLSQVEDHVAQSVHGTASEVAQQLTELVRRTGADEVVAFASTYDRQALADSDAALAELQVTH